MRAVFHFTSLLAAGLLIAAAIAVALGGGGPRGAAIGVSDPAVGFALDYPSLLIGLVIGIVLPMITRVAWADLPRRAIQWLLGHEYEFYGFAIMAFLLGVILFY